MIDDENGNDPFMKCVIKNNYDFMFDVLFEDKCKKFIPIDKTNNKGKSLIHLLLESNILNKNLMLLQMLKEGFIFNDVKITIQDFIKGAKKYFVLFIVVLILCFFFSIKYFYE